MQALTDCNVNHAASYGTDDYSDKAIEAFKKHFGPKCRVYFVFNGTAANVLALRSIMQRHQAVLCTSISHLNVDECGAPEFFAGKLLPLAHVNGKLTLEILKKSLIRQGDQHYSQPKIVSLTQPTELGTCYSLEELKQITDWAHSQKMYVHIDGSRLANAVHFLKTTFKKMTTELEIDIVSMGGTKNGFMMGEAIIVLNPHLAEDLKYIRKQSAQLPSKTRFIAAQFLHYLEDNLFTEISGHVTTLAARLYQGLSLLKNIKITQLQQSNAVFAVIPQPWIKTLREKYFFYVWDETTFECRLMVSWDSTAEEIDTFIALCSELNKRH